MRVCKRGHVLTESNAYRGPDGALVCRACDRIRQKEMPPEKKRRTVSTTGDRYRRFQVLAEREGKSVSNKLQEIIDPLIAGIPDPGVRPRRESKPPAGPMDDLRALDEAFGPRFSG